MGYYAVGSIDMIYGDAFEGENVDIEALERHAEGARRLVHLLGGGGSLAVGMAIVVVEAVKARLRRRG